MPTRTVLPTISLMWTTTSSPTMIFSPARRVMSSMVPPWIQLRADGCVWISGGRDGREQRGANGSVRGLIDQLVALTLGDEDRRAQVGVEVGGLGARPHRHEDGDVGGVGGDRRGRLVGQVDLVVAEEVPRVRDRQRQRRVVERVQPAERAVVGRDERVATAAEADQARRELEDVLGGDLERAEARGV